MIGLSPQSWDSFVTRYTFKVLKYVNWEIDPFSKLTGSWFAVESPTFLISSILIYLVIVHGSCYWIKLPLSNRAPDTLILDLI